LSKAGIWQAALARERTAIANGALLPIATECSLVQEGAIPFVLRNVDTLAVKAAKARMASSSAASQATRSNPFLPADPVLTVGRVGTSHLCLLNKYPVIAHHLLLVTRHFQPQRALLDESDFHALGQCLEQVDGLAFYNGGPEAGASQPHKHLQLVPLPLGPGPESMPWGALLESALGSEGEVVCSRELTFRHALVRGGLSAGQEAGAALDRYRALLQAVGISDRRGIQSAPYNLLLRRNWMLLVPRTREAWEGISINALAFAGALLVRDRNEAIRLRQGGFLRALGRVAVPMNAAH
jgi:ATP adenylyltransferase